MLRSYTSRKFTSQDSSSADNVCHIGWPIIEVAVINEDDYQLALQDQFGKVFDPRYMLVFQAQVLQLHTVVSSLCVNYFWKIIQVMTIDTII